MLTSKSPRKVFLLTHELVRQVLPRYSCKFSRHDFTWAQLFACLVLREHQRKSYRGTEALLRDVTWWHEIGMRKVPDHNTLNRAFHAILSESMAQDMLSLLAKLWKRHAAFGQIVGIDSTYLDTHHHSRHYEHRCRRQTPTAPRNSPQIKARQRARVRSIPKLAMSVEVRTHWILAVQTRVGMCGDHRDFKPLVQQTHARTRKLRVVLADAGFDDHANHVLAREDLGIQALIRTPRGGPSISSMTSPYRRAMKRQLAGSQAGKTYGLRSSVETTNSMLKRNLGDSLRARTGTARCREMELRAITHNLMILWAKLRVETKPVGTTIWPIHATVFSRTALAQIRHTPGARKHHTGATAAL
jgi:hypothetical protein